jgi:N-acyl-D-aspartate/D-glutamate deacylase
MHDLLFKGALVADGSGAPPRRADVAVAGGRIAALGEDLGAAHEAVDADGLVLAPGIVDVHTHYDAQLTWDATASPSPALGVTTVVMGNCGFGIAPCPAARRGQIVRNLAVVEGLSLGALESGIDWDFESFEEYLALLGRKGAYPNVAVLVGHSTVRSAVMGEAASERVASPDEVAAMAALVSGAMAAGAIGFASSTSENHIGHGGVPMPSRLADEAEIRALVGAMGESGRGLFQMTVGPGTDVPFLESLAAASGRPVVFSALFHNETYPERAPAMLAACRAAQARGHEVHAQVGCQPLAMDFTLANAYPLHNLEVWEDLKASSAAELAGIFRDADFRARFRADVANPRKGRMFYGDWRLVEVAQAARSGNAALEGLSVAELAAREGTDPVDVFFDLALDEELETVFSAKLLNVDEDAVEGLLTHEASLVSLSDAGAHLTFMCDAGYGLRLLGHWVRERGTFELGEAIRQLTSLPADVYRIPERGRVMPGAWADLMLFDPATVDVSKSRRVHDLPGGDSRLVREPVGLHGVWVNGARVHDGRAYLEVDRPPGQILQEFSI